jgi:hypothetical protein
MSSSTTDVHGRMPAVWAALLGAPLAWAIQFGLVWYLADHLCASLQGPPAAPSVQRGVFGGIGLAAAVVAVAALRGGWKIWRDPGESPSQEYLGAGAALISGIFLGAILLTLLAALTLPLCAVTR